MKNFGKYEVVKGQLHLHCSNKVEFAGFAYKTGYNMKTFIDDINFKGDKVVIVKEGIPIAKYNIEDIKELIF